MQSPKKDACQILPYSKEAPIQCLPQPASLVKRLYFSMHLTTVIASNHCYTPPRLSVASHLPCSQITFAHLSSQPVARCSCTAFKLKAESERTHKKVEKKKWKQTYTKSACRAIFSSLCSFKYSPLKIQTRFSRIQAPVVSIVIVNNLNVKQILTI